MSGAGSRKRENSDGFQPHSDEEPLPQQESESGLSVSISFTPKSVPETPAVPGSSAPKFKSFALASPRQLLAPALPQSPPGVPLPAHWADHTDSPGSPQQRRGEGPRAERKRSVDDLLHHSEEHHPHTSSEDHHPLLLVPKSSEEQLAQLQHSDDQEPVPVPPSQLLSDELRGDSVTPDLPSIDQADIVNPERNDAPILGKFRFIQDMAKKPSTSSLDRSDIVDFVVDDRSPEETKAIYNNWATNYEEDMAMQKYKAPSIMAHFINQELQVKKDAVILDVGCGTGLLGVQLKNLGYSYIDALDYSEEMMTESKKKNIYRRHFLEKVYKNNQLPLTDGEYDVVALCGCLMPGHIMPDALPEVARLLKPGGRLMWIHRTLDHYESKSEQFLETRFTGTLQSLCRQFRMEIVVRKKVQDYRLKCDGQIFALKKK
ncbi:uncharacterized protein LOC144106502 isoform X2 [Amblyomma americanum]